MAQKNNIKKIKPIAGSHQEPTWGDPAKINLIINGLGCSNKTTLLTAFGSVQNIKDLHMCRNACAHLTADVIHNVNAAKVRYIDTKMEHPSDVMFWVNPATNDYLWRSWVEEMSIISSLAIK